jgi:hypothetical protein
LSSCDDSTGTKTTSGGSGHLDTSTPGPHTYTITATSDDGQTANSQITYAVAAAPSAAITAPVPGRTYTIGQPVTTRFACAEGTNGPGLSSCDDSTGTKTKSGGSGHLDTSTAGPHTYIVTATSSDGQSASTKITYTVTTGTLRVSALELTPRAFAAAPSGPAISTDSDAGVTIRYRDSLDALSDFTVLFCAGPHGRCDKLAGTFSHLDHAGANRLDFSGRLHGHALAPGRYVLSVTATLAGQHSPAITAGFAISAPPLPHCPDPDLDGDCDLPGQT